MDTCGVAAKCFRASTQKSRIIPISELSSHLSHTALEHLADISRFGQDVHVWDTAQVHGCVDIEALGLPWGSHSLHWAVINPQVTGLLVPLGYNSVPLAQRDRLGTEEDRLA